MCYDFTYVYIWLGVIFLLTLVWDSSLVVKGFFIAKFDSFAKVKIRKN